MTLCQRRGRCKSFNKDSKLCQNTELAYNLCGIWLALDTNV
jgi:hypothetical protein